MNNFVKLIGRERFVVLMIVALVNAALGAVLFAWVSPLHQDAVRRKAQIQREITDLRSSIANIKKEMEEFKVNQVLYEQLEAEGFFQEQDRFVIDRHLKEFREASQILGFSYSVSEVQEIKDNDLKNAGFRKLLSEVEVTSIASYFDTDVFTFLEYVNRQFSGHINLVSFDLSRDGEITTELLQKISQGQVLPTVKGNLKFEWYSLGELSQEEKEKLQGARGGGAGNFGGAGYGGGYGGPGDGFGGGFAPAQRGY